MVFECALRWVGFLSCAQRFHRMKDKQNLFCTTVSIYSHRIYTIYSHRIRKPYNVSKIAQKSIGTPLPVIQDIYMTRSLRKIKCTMDNCSHLALILFTFSLSGKWLRTFCTSLSRFRDSFSLNATMQHCLTYTNVQY